MLINLPYKILVERSVKGKLNPLLKEMRLGKKGAVISTEGIMKIVGLDLDADFVEPDAYDKTYCERLAKKLKNYDFVIGVGGGRIIDIAKYSSFLAKRPWIAFPTILSHDGVVSSRASLDSNGVKVSINAIEPIAIIADLSVIRKAPYRHLAAGAGDLLAKMSAVEDWKLAARRGKEPYHVVMGELSLLSAKAVMENVDDIRRKTEHGIEILLWALISAGFAMNIYGSSRPGSGSEHNFSHALEKLGSKALHGEQTALGTIISIYLQKGDWRGIKSTMKNLKLPTTAKEVSLEKDVLVKALVMAPRIRNRYTVLNECNINEKKAEKILKKTGII